MAEETETLPFQANIDNYKSLAELTPKEKLDLLQEVLKNPQVRDNETESNTRPVERPKKACKSIVKERVAAMGLDRVIATPYSPLLKACLEKLAVCV